MRVDLLFNCIMTMTRKLTDCKLVWNNGRGWAELRKSRMLRGEGESGVERERQDFLVLTLPCPAIGNWGKGIAIPNDKMSWVLGGLLVRLRLGIIG